jgi:hypothetical protein
MQGVTACAFFGYGSTVRETFAHGHFCCVFEELTPTCGFIFVCDNYVDDSGSLLGFNEKKVNQWGVFKKSVAA